MPIYCGVGGVKRKIAGLYTGIGGVKKEVSELCAGDGGVKRLVYQYKKTVGRLSVGSVVKMGKYYGADIYWVVADHNHAGYPSNSTTIVSERVLTFKCFDAKESGGDTKRQQFGNNQYILSNIRKWLNSNGTGWYNPQHTYDQPPSDNNVFGAYNDYYNEYGFLTGFSAEILNSILTTTLTVEKPTLDGGGLETFQDKVFLLSKSEVGFGNQGGISDGVKLSLFTSDASRISYPTHEAVENSEYKSGLSDLSPCKWLTRSPDSSDASSTIRVYKTGIVNIGTAFDGSDIGIRVALNLRSDMLVSEDGFILP